MVGYDYRIINTWRRFSVEALLNLDAFKLKVVLESLLHTHLVPLPDLLMSLCLISVSLLVFHYDSLMLRIFINKVTNLLRYSMQTTHSDAMLFSRGSSSIKGADSLVSFSAALLCFDSYLLILSDSLTDCLTLSFTTRSPLQTFYAGCLCILDRWILRCRWTSCQRCRLTSQRSPGNTANRDPSWTSMPLQQSHVFGSLDLTCFQSSTSAHLNCKRFSLPCASRQGFGKYLSG